MLDRIFAPVLVGVTLVLGGCREAAPPPAAPAVTPTVAATPAATAPPAVVAAASPAALVLSATAVEPTGPAPLSAGAETVVDPAASFTVDVSVALPDARLVLLDAQEAHVPATHVREVGTATRFSLSPASPLVPASRYLLRIEGGAGRELRDARGAELAPLTFAVLVAGTPPPPEPKPAPRKRRRR